jgi:hypothetical protein
MKVVFNTDERVTGLEAIFLLILNSSLIFPNICIDIFVSVIAGALAGCLVGLLPIGSWVSNGLSLIHMTVRLEELSKFGAALGFIRCFVRTAHSSGHTKVSS